MGQGYVQFSHSRLVVVCVCVCVECFLFFFLETCLLNWFDNPDANHDFVSGFHVVRRSDRLKTALSTDLVIRQVLMRSLKTSEGLTRGRGMNEQQRLI